MAKGFTIDVSIVELSSGAHPTSSSETGREAADAAKEVLRKVLLFTDFRLGLEDTDCDGLLKHHIRQINQHPAKLSFDAK